jgi:hypothetical protein
MALIPQDIAHKLQQFHVTHAAWDYGGKIRAGRKQPVSN